MSDQAPHPNDDNVTPFPGSADEAGSDSGADDAALDRLPSTGFLSFYDRLRERVVRYVERRGGKLGAGTTEALLLIPDVFILVLRLAFDKDVPKENRMLLGSALAYFVMPIDLLPEAFTGAAGYMDDMILALMVLSQAFGDELEPYAAKHWSGSVSIRKTLHDILGAAHSLLGHDLYEKLKDLLARRGVDVRDDLADREDGDPSEPAASPDPEPAPV